MQAETWGSRGRGAAPSHGRGWQQEHFPSLAPWPSSLPSTVSPPLASASPAPCPCTPLVPRHLCKQRPVTPQPRPNSPIQTRLRACLATGHRPCCCLPSTAGHISSLDTTARPRPGVFWAPAAPGNDASATCPTHTARHREGAKPSLRHGERVAETSVQTRMPEVGESPGPAGSSLPVLLPSPSNHPCPACPAFPPPGLLGFLNGPARSQLKLGLSLPHRSKPLRCSSPGTLCPGPTAHATAADWDVFHLGSHPQPSLRPVNPGSWLVLPVSPAPTPAFPLLLAAPFPHFSWCLRTLLDHDPLPAGHLHPHPADDKDESTPLKGLFPPSLLHSDSSPVPSTAALATATPWSHHCTGTSRPVPGHGGMEAPASSPPAPCLIFAPLLYQLGPGGAWVCAVVSRMDLQGDLVPPPCDGTRVYCCEAQQHKVTMGRSHPRLPSRHQAGRGHLA